VSPIYLGKHPTENHWFFFANKEGAGRFVRYFTHGNVAYPSWVRADQVPSILVIDQLPPQEISEEVEQFLKGSITYEIVPRVRGRAERVIRTYNTPVDGEEEVFMESDNSSTAANSGERGCSSRGISDVANGTALLNVGGDRVSLKKIGEALVIKGNLRNQAGIEPPAAIDSKTKRTRRTKAQMELDRIKETPVVPLVAEVVIIPEVIKQKRNRRTKAEMEAFRRNQPQEPRGD
jgi:hypothetical protein